MQITGDEIKKLTTMKSMYDHDCIVATTNDGRDFRLEMSELIKMFGNHILFSTEKKRVHTYLKVEDIMWRVDEENR